MATRAMKEEGKRRVFAFIQAGRMLDAKHLLTQFCAADKRDEEIWFLLGAVNGRLGLLAEAIKCNRQAIKLRPSYADAHYNVGLAYKQLGNLAEAETSLKRVVKIKPDYAEALDNLGYVLQEMGKTEEAIRCYRRALELRPDFVGTRFLLAALEGDATPEAAPPEYVKGLFDNYADRFEEDLVENLGYQIPEVILNAVKTVLGERCNGLRVLDMGCGTGLCGVLLRDLADRLVGVDLSPRMVQKAQDKGVYDELLEGDVLLPLRGADASFDLLVAADVFIYIGDLVEVFGSSAGALSDGGVFAFSVEGLAGEGGYRLQTTDRYAHSADYIRELAEVSGLAVCSIDEVMIRKHKGVPVPGYVAVLQKRS